MAKLVFHDPAGNYFGTARDGIHITTADAKSYAHIQGDSVISPAGVIIGHIRGGHVKDLGGKTILSVKEEK